MNQVIMLTAVSYVAGFFADMVNPENRGGGFSWETFPELAASKALDGCIRHHYKEEYNSAQVKEGALLYAASLVKRAGL